MGSTAAVILRISLVLISNKIPANMKKKFRASSLLFGTNGGKILQMGQNTPNGGKILQMGAKYSKWGKILQIGVKYSK
jgi:hypothetical protein